MVVGCGGGGGVFEDRKSCSSSSAMIKSFTSGVV